MKKLIAIHILVLASLSALALNADSVLYEIENTKTNAGKISKYYELADYFRTRNLANSIEYAEKGIALSRAMSDSSQIITGLYYSGKSYAEVGIYDKAIDQLTELREISKEINNDKRYLEAIISLGTVALHQNDYELALVFYRDALSYMNESKCYDKAFAIYMNIGVCFNPHESFDSVLYYLHKTRELLEKGDNHFSVGHVYLNLGSLYYDFGNIDSAQFYLNKSLAHSHNMRTTAKSGLYSLLSQMMIDRGDLASANSFLDSAYSNFKTGGSLLSEKRYCYTKIHVDTLVGNYKSALATALQLNKVNGKLQEQNKTDFKTYYDLRLRESEIEKLSNENAYITVKAKNSMILVFSLAIILILLVVIVVLYYKADKNKKRSIRELTLTNENLKEHREELMTLNNRLSSQRKGLESTLIKLERTKKQLIRTEKMAGLGVMAAGISHEINNPLNYINGGLYLFESIRSKIESDPEIASDFRKSCKMIEEGAMQVHSVVRAMNQFAEIKEENIEKVSLNEIVRETLEGLIYKKDKDLELETKLCDIPLYACDRNKVKQVFVQIISNAIDASREVPKDKQRKIVISSYTAKIDTQVFVTVKVSNSGQRIKQDNIDKIFDPFFTTKDPYKGYGLGLSIAYNLVKEMDGKILVNNTDSGVEFVTLLPLESKITIASSSN